MGTFEGLGVPLSGDYKRYSEAQVELLSVTDQGQTSQTIAHNAAMNTFTGVTYMEGVHLQTNITTTTSGTSTLWVGAYHVSGTTGGQVYAAEFWLNGAAGQAIAGGRCSAIHLIVNHAATYGQSGNSATSFIHLSSVDALVPSFITFSGETVDGAGGCIAANAATQSTQGICIYIANAPYYIMVTSCTD